MSNRYWLNESVHLEETTENDDLLPTISNVTTTIHDEENDVQQTTSVSRVSQILQIAKASSQSRASTRGTPNYFGDAEYVPLQNENNNDEDNEEIQFFVDNNYQQLQNIPSSFACPPTLKEMMVIVNSLREQRAEYLAKFNFVAPNASSAQSPSSTPANDASQTNSAHTNDARTDYDVLG